MIIPSKSFFQVSSKNFQTNEHFSEKNIRRITTEYCSNLISYDSTRYVSDEYQTRQIMFQFTNIAFRNTTH